MVPPDQRLDRHHPAGTQIHLGLVVHDERLALDAVAQVQLDIVEQQVFQGDGIGEDGGIVTPEPFAATSARSA